MWKLTTTLLGDIWAAEERWAGMSFVDRMTYGTFASGG